MNSFDFFDTLVVRRLARPALVFDLVERCLPWPGFARLRVRAEAQARKRHAPREVTLADIYAELPDDPQRERARQEELRLELALLSPVRNNLRRMRGDDVVVSDFYIGAQHLREALSGLGQKPMPQLRVSCEVGRTKQEGGLWDALAAEGIQPDIHVGDDAGADGVEARKRGIKAALFREAALTRWEAAWAGRRDISALDAGAVAGCARAARLLHFEPSEPAAEQTLCDLFGAVVAPALVAFVDHVLDRCIALGIQRALFMAPSGQLLHRLAQQRVRTRGLAIEAVYAHGSDVALRLPGFTTIERAESGPLENTAGLSLAELPERARLATHAYYKGLGLAGAAPLALVDVGWSGRMQASLRSFLERGGQVAAPLHGFYFCLAQREALGERDSMEGFAFDPARDRGRNRFDGQRAMVEALLEADEGTTLGFEMRKGKAWPVLADRPAQAALRLVQLQQGAVLAFTNEWAQLEAATRGAVRIDARAALDVLLQLLYRPGRDEALAFAGRERGAGVGAAAMPLVAGLATGAALARRESWGLWPEGTLAMRGAAPLAPLMHLVRRLRKA